MQELILRSPGVVQFLADSPFEVKPGVFLPMFVNLKETWAYPQVRNKIALGLAEKIGDQCDWICGLESGGSYYATTVADILGKPVSLYRKESKGYGTQNSLVGHTPPTGSRVALVDDVYATGRSGVYAAGLCASMGCDASLYTVFSYSSDLEMMQRLGVPATALTYFKGIRQSAVEAGMLSQQEADIVTEQVDVYRNTIFQ